MCSIVFAESLVLAGIVLPAGPLSLSPQALRGDAPDWHSGKQEPREARPLDREMALRMWRLTVALELTQAAASGLFGVLERFNVRMAKLKAEEETISRQMHAEAQARVPDAARLRILIDQLWQNRARQNVVDKERIDRLREGLTPLQQARLLVVLPRLEEARRSVAPSSKHSVWRRGPDQTHDGTTGRDGIR
jgi:hypothetical protein